MCHLPVYFPLDRVWSVSDSSASGSLEGLFQDVTETQVQGRKKKKKHLEICALNTDLFTDQSCTHQSVICCGTRCGCCCTSEDSHRSVPGMSKGDEVSCPQWPKKPLYIPNQRQGWELDPSQPNIPLVWVHCRCTLLLRSSSIWFGRFLMCLCSKRVNKFTSWYVCGSLGKCAADSFNLTSCYRPELFAKFNVTNCKGHSITWKFREFFQIPDGEMKRSNTKAHNLVSAGEIAWNLHLCWQ